MEKTSEKPFLIGIKNINKNKEVKKKMPGGDRTGPEGQGPMTGRRAGFCTGNQAPGYEKPRYGFGRGLGRGSGRGYGRGFWRRDTTPEPYYHPNTYPHTISKDEEKTYLEETAKNLEQEIKSIRKRIEEISKEKKDTP